jgi:hypothetical protein
VALVSRWLLTKLSRRRLSPVWLGSVSCSRSSNRTGRFPASGSRKRHTMIRGTPSTTSEHKPGAARLLVHPHVLRGFLRPSLTEAPFLHRHGPASQVLRASPPPHTAWPVSHELPVDPLQITAGVSRVAAGLLCLHAVALTPAGPLELIRSSFSIVSGLPWGTVRSAPAIVVSGPAQRSLTLRPARSPSRLATLSIESSDRFVASTIVSIATGWSESVPGRELHPLKSSAFSRRTVTPTSAFASVVYGAFRAGTPRSLRCRVKPLEVVRTS